MTHNCWGTRQAHLPSVNILPHLVRKSDSARILSLSQQTGHLKAMAIFLLLTACAVASCLAAPTNEVIDPNNPPTWMGKCGEKEEDVTMFKTKVETMQRCYENVFNSSTGIPREFEEGANNSVAEEGPCSSLTTYVTCVEDFLSSLQDCFDEDQQSAMQTTVNGTKAMFTAICDGVAREAVNVSASSETSDADCLRTQETVMFTCFGDRLQERSVAEMEENSNMALALLEMIYDENTCRTLHEVWQCVNDVFSSCSNSTIIPIIQEGMVQFYETTPCTRLLATPNPADMTTPFFFS